jgi:hypothetical protein
MRCGQDGPDARRPTQAICRYGQGGERGSRRAAAWSRGPDFRGCDRGGVHEGRGKCGALGPLRGRTYAHGRRHCSALRGPSWPQPRRGRGNLGAFLCREPSQYRHIASGSPPRTASHIASVAHVPIYEIGSNTPLYSRVHIPDKSRSSKSFGDNRRPAAAAFSSRCATDAVPGIGSIKRDWPSTLCSFCTETIAAMRFSETPGPQLSACRKMHSPGRTPR